MKIFCSSTTNLYGISSPFKYKSISDINTKSSSPIKVRKKQPHLIKVNSLESFKLFGLSSRNRRNLIKNELTKINLNLFINNNIMRHNTYPSYYYIKIANQILFNLPNHLVSTFKDYLIWNENYDYLKNFYNLEKSIELIPKLGNYYETYTLFIPIYFPLTDLKSLISKYIKNKMKFFEVTEEDNENLKDEIKDIDKNIIENNDNINKDNNNIKINNNGTNNENNKKENNELNKENNEKKLINTTEIRTEKSCSVSNYFGIDSIIKPKENSNFGVNNNFENQLINYSLLEQIKYRYKNKKDKDKENDNLDYSLELAAIIQSFEEKERNYYENNKNRLINSCKTKKQNDFSQNINKYRTNNNFYRLKLKDNSKIIKSVNNRINSKLKINNQKLNYKLKNIVSTSRKHKVNSNIENYKQNFYNLKNKTKNKSNDFYSENHQTIIPEKIQILNKNNNDLFAKDNTINADLNKNNYHTYIENKKKTLCILQKNLHNAFTPKDNNESNSELNSIKYKKIIKKKNKSMIYKIIKKDNNNSIHIDNNIYSKNKNKKINNLSLNFMNKFNSNKSNIFYNKISSSPILKLNIMKKSSRNRYDDIGRSKSYRHCVQRDNLSFNSKKIIFVNRKKEMTNSIIDSKTSKQNTLTTSFKNYNSSNSNKEFNKITVNKKDYLTKSIKKEKTIDIVKNNNNSIDLDTCRHDFKNYLNQYKSFIENEYKTFIPKLIMKKMFFNKLKCEKIINSKKINPDYLFIKKHNISSKKSENTCSSSNINNTKTTTINNNSNNNNNNHINNNNNHTNNNQVNNSNKNGINNTIFPKTCSNYKNKRILTEFNKLIKINVRNETPSPSKAPNKLRNKNISKISNFPKNESTPVSKIKYNFFKDNNNSSQINKYDKTLKEINNLKKKHTKSFNNKNNLLINVNIYNNFKINSENNDDKIKINRKITLNDSLKTSFINKNKISTLVKKSTKHNNQKKSIQFINIKQNLNKDNCYSIEASGDSKREKIKYIRLK